MTGLYPHNTAVWHGRVYTLPATARTWLRAIRDAGYRTCAVGKLHLHPHEGDLRDRHELVRAWGFDEAVETTGPRASVTARSEMTDEWERVGLWDAFVAARDRMSPGESATFGSYHEWREDEHDRDAARMLERWGDVLADDPMHNPNLALDAADPSRLAFPPRVSYPWRAGATDDDAAQVSANRVVESRVSAGPSNV